MNAYSTDEPSGHLTSDKRQLLWDAIMAHGNVVRFDQLRALRPERREDSMRRMVSQVVHAGWLVHIKKGLYEVADLASLGTHTLPRPAEALLLEPESYVSLEMAMQHHGYFDQGLYTVTSMSLKARPPVELGPTRYKFVRVGERHFWGYEELKLGRYPARVAYLEKALIDKLRLDSAFVSVDEVAEVLATPNGIDLERMTEYLLRSPLRVLRTGSFLLEVLGRPIDERLVVAAQSSRSLSRITAKSTVLDRKWRLYHESAQVEHARAHLDAW